MRRAREGLRHPEGSRQRQERFGATWRGAVVLERGARFRPSAGGGSDHDVGAARGRAADVSINSRSSAARNSEPVTQIKSSAPASESARSHAAAAKASVRNPDKPADTARAARSPEESARGLPAYSVRMSSSN